MFYFLDDFFERRYLALRSREGALDGPEPMTVSACREQQLLEETRMSRRQTTPQDSQFATASLARPPEGFHRVGSVTAACWFSLEVGNTLRGKLLGIYERDDKRSKTGKSEFFQVLLTDSTRGRFGTGEKAEVREAEAGLIVNMNCNTKTSSLKTLIGDIHNGAEYEIYVVCNKKIELKNGNTMWDIETFTLQLRPPRAAEADFGSSDGDAGSQDAA
jgi:hypothetical protein